MPELPEVETVRQILRIEVVGKTIQKIEIYKPEDETKRRVSLIKEISEAEFINVLIGKTIHEIDRKGKCLFFILGNQKDTHVLVSRLGMTGKYFIEDKILTPASEQEKKDLFEKHNTDESRILTFYLDNGQESTKLIYCDSRRFGSFRLQTFEDYKNIEPYKSIGTDLLEEKVDIGLLFEHYQKRKLPIKTALLEQKIISGIGNIYASEILFDTKIHPLKRTNQLTRSEVESIVRSAQTILKEALDEKGTSEFDFVNPLSEEGSYQKKLKVYNRAGKPCPNCGSLIKRMDEEEEEKFTLTTERKKISTCPWCRKGFFDRPVVDHPECFEIKKSEKTNKNKQKKRSTFFCSQCQKLEL